MMARSSAVMSRWNVGLGFSVLTKKYISASRWDIVYFIYIMTVLIDSTLPITCTSSPQGFVEIEA
jgi:hypothetical protein